MVTISSPLHIKAKAHALTCSKAQPRLLPTQIASRVCVRRSLLVRRFNRTVLGIAEVIPPALPAALMQSAEPSIARGKRPLLPAASRIARWGRQFYCLFAVRRAGDPLAPQNQSLTFSTSRT